MDTKRELQGTSNTQAPSQTNELVLDKSIFSNIFEKDIKRVYLYKKAERLAKAIHLVTPAFVHTQALRDRIDRIAIGLIDGAILPPGSAREALSRELLALSSLLAIARTSGILSSMNADLIGREARLLLQEVAGYEEPRLFFDESPTLAELARSLAGSTKHEASTERHPGAPSPVKDKGQNKRHIKDTNERRETILSVLRAKGPSPIKNLSIHIRDISEKTIQRELAALVLKGVVRREGDRRWTTYALV